MYKIKKKIFWKDVSKFGKPKINAILVNMADGAKKDTFDLSVEMARISFVYEGIGSKFCLWLPVSTKNTVE